MTRSSNTPSFRYTGLTLALAAAVGIVASRRFAVAAGFTSHGNQEPAQFCSGIVLFCLTFFLLRFLFQFGSQCVARLAQINQRPKTEVVVAILACGTLCVLGGLYVAWHADAAEFGAAQAVNGLRNMPGGNMLSDVDFMMYSNSSLIRPLAAAAAMLIGGALLALGVWAALPPGAVQGRPQDATIDDAHNGPSGTTATSA